MDKKNIMENLMEQGKAKGKLTTKEINDALEKLDYDVDQIDQFYENCEQFHIEIIDDMSENPLTVSDCDNGKVIRRQIADLMSLLEAYRSGELPEKGKA